MDKLVRSRRGGYCFEHNLLFKAALESLGFRPVGLTARVLLGQKEDAETVRTHMLLHVNVEGVDVIADTGFGGQVPTAPLRLMPDIMQETPHEPYRLEEIDGVWGLRALVGGDWRLLYRFTLEPAFGIDYVVANHYIATHPASYFTQALVAARVLPEGRLALLNRRLTEHRLGQTPRTDVIDDDAVLRTVVAERFRIVLDDAHWERVMRKVGDTR